MNKQIPFASLMLLTFLCSTITVAQVPKADSLTDNLDHVALLVQQFQNKSVEIRFFIRQLFRSNNKRHPDITLMCKWIRTE